MFNCWFSLRVNSYIILLKSFIEREKVWVLREQKREENEWRMLSGFEWWAPDGEVRLCDPGSAHRGLPLTRLSLTFHPSISFSSLLILVVFSALGLIFSLQWEMSFYESHGSNRSYRCAAVTLSSEMILFKSIFTASHVLSLRVSLVFIKSMVFKIRQKYIFDIYILFDTTHFFITNDSRTVFLHRWFCPLRSTWMVPF